MKHITLSTALLSLSALAHDATSHLILSPEASDAPLSGHVFAGWESRYFSEGRDALAGDALMVSSAEVRFPTFSMLRFLPLLCA